jgi:hypothetical protein
VSELEQIKRELAELKKRVRRLELEKMSTLDLMDMDDGPSPYDLSATARRGKR